MDRIRSDRILLPDRLFDGYIYIEDGKICDVTEDARPSEREYDARGLYVSPGFIDTHTHGGGGYAFEGSAEDIVKGALFHLAHGTTTVCPTISAAPFSDMARSVAQVEAAMNDTRYPGTILGAHLEGPYLSPAQAGAQAPEVITAPREEEYLPLLEAHSRAIARWSYAPERDEDARFAKALARFGVVASAGHTDAIYADMQRAMEQGLRLVTHFYSCTSTVTRDHGFRRLGVIETAYLEDALYVEIIADGKHLPPELIRLICKLKGTDRVALTTDSLALAGTDKTHGFMQSTEFIIEDGVCKLVDRSAFAGSIATADRLVRVVHKEAGLPLGDAVKMITEVPARIMGLSHKGRIAPHMDADLVAFDEDIRPRMVMANGKLCFTEQL